MIDDIYQITITATLQGQTCQNVLHYQVTADADYVAFAAGVIDWFNTAMEPAMAAVMTSDVQFTNLRMQKILPIPAFVAVDTPLVTSGVLSGSTMPSEVALVVTKTTILAGRRYRGRLYLYGQLTSAMNAVTGLFDAATVANAQIVGNILSVNIQSIPVGGTLKPIILHRVGATTTTITGGTARNTPRCQRRRQPGRGI